MASSRRNKAKPPPPFARTGGAAVAGGGGVERGGGGGRLSPGETLSLTLKSASAALLLSLLVQFLRSVPSSSRGSIDVPSAIAERRRRESENGGYDLLPTSGPRLSGLPLRLFAKSLRVPLLGDALIRGLFERNDYGWVRRFASTLDEEEFSGGHTYMPAYYAEVPLTEEEMERHVEAARGFDVGAFARAAPGRTVPHRDDDEEGNDGGGGEEEAEAAPFRHWTADDYTSRYKSGEMTPTDAIRRVLAAVRRSRTTGMAAFQYVNETDALLQAEASASRYKSKAALGPLDGVPLAVKDELDVAGYVTILGTSLLADPGRTSPALRDCLPVSRARSAGMIIVGKTSMHEFGIGTTGHNPHHGTPRNPYGPGTHYPGGSSSGSASAVSSGLVPAALGADGGGSIRVPSALCGVVGLKPTYGRVAHPHGGAPSVAHVGPIANSVKDAALLYLTVSGPAPEATGARVPHPPPYISLRRNLADDARPLEGLRIGVHDEYFDDADPAVVGACRSALDYFVSHGATLVPVRILHLEAIKLAHAVTILTEMATSKGVYWDDVRRFSLDAQVKMALGRALSSRDFLAAQKIRSYALNATKALFADVDVIATPATALAAPPIPHDAVEEGDSDVAMTMALMRYVALGNFVGIPGIVFPVGYDEDGLPIGMQLMAWQWEEDVLFRTAKAAEGMLPRGVRRPEEYYDVLGGEWDLSPWEEQK